MKANLGGSPAAPSQVCGFEPGHMRIFFQKTVDETAESARPLPMNDTEARDSPPAAFLDVLRHKVFNMLLSKGKITEDLIEML